MSKILDLYKHGVKHLKELTRNSIIFNNCFYIPRGLTARISGFHPEGPGSTPGVGNFYDVFDIFTAPMLNSGRKSAQKSLKHHKKLVNSTLST